MIRERREEPRDDFISMLIGSVSVFLIAQQPVSYIIATATIVFLLTGYGVARFLSVPRAARYVETVCLSLTVFLLIVPAVSETLRRVPDGHPFVTSLNSPLLLGAQASLLAMLILGLTVQILRLRQKR